jgi:hypothetical protein
MIITTKILVATVCKAVQADDRRTVTVTDLSPSHLGDSCPLSSHQSSVLDFYQGLVQCSYLSVQYQEVLSHLILKLNIILRLQQNKGKDPQDLE